MARFIRWHRDEFVHFITNRTEHACFFLLPTQKINQLILFWLTKAKEKKGKHIQLFSFVFMSNHFHFLLADPEGELAEFMGYFEGNLAKAINKVIGRKGRFWSREYDDVILAGDDEFWDRYAYNAANPVAAGLVNTPFQWGGISSVSFVKNNLPVTGRGLNVTRYGNASRHKRKVKKKKFEESYAFNLSCPPMLREESVENQATILNEAIKDAGTNAMDVRKSEKLPPCMGMKKVLAQSPYNSPSSPARRPRFKIMAFCKATQKKMEKKYKAFVDDYRSCCQALIVYFKSIEPLNGLSIDEIKNKISRYVQKAPTIDWPFGCYVPTTHKPVGIEIAGIEST